jgi:hypothetical protein
MNQSTLLLVLAFISSTAFSQNTTYFQQEVNYLINVSLDDEEHELLGDIEIEYTNHSPNALAEIYMHLWPNAYKNAQTALAKQQLRLGNKFMFYALEKELGYIDQIHFKVDGEEVAWDYDPEHIDIAKITLKKPLQSGQTIVISTPFHVKIPSGKISRLGHIDQSYQITQWYPKPAVYDQDGWHAMPYLNMGEFYSEYGSFDVSITLPNNYVVGATGDLQTDSEVAFLDELAAKEGNQNGDNSNAYPASSEEMKTIRFTQKRVHDFAWFADKRYVVRKGEVSLPDAQRKVTTWAMFTPENSEEWSRAIEYINDGVYYYSLWNGDYPYQQVTAVDGAISAGGGMEYPNVTVIGNAGSDLGLETVIVHEVGHNWFYGILGSNERNNAWMDEGLNSFNETRYFRTKYQDSLHFLEGMLPERLVKLMDLQRFPYQTIDSYTYLISARNNEDQPMQCHSNAYTNTNYGTIVYKKTALAMSYLMQSLGEEAFDQAMRNYYETWKFKHPSPDDLRQSLEQSTGKDLSWFFEDVVPSTKQTDYAIRNASLKGKQTTVQVKNRGEVPAPFQVVAYKDSTVVFDQWYEALEPGNRTELELGVSSDRVEIDPNWESLDVRRQNNTYRTDGILGGIEPLKLKFLTDIEDPSKTQLFWAPVLAFNVVDRFMFGLNLHNATIPLKKFEFSLTPMYSAETNRIVGVGRLSYYERKSAFHLQTRRFTQYSRGGGIFDQELIYTRTGFTFEHQFNRRPGSNLSSELEVELAHIYTDYSETRNQPVEPSNPVTFRGFQHNGQSNIRYSIEKTGLVRHRAVIGLRSYFRDITDPDFSLFDKQTRNLAEFTYQGKTAYMRGHDIHWRAYAGITFDAYSPYSISAFGWQGATDFTYDYLFFDRGGSNGDFFPRMVRGDQGALFNGLFSNHFMTTFRADMELPKVKFISLFAGIGLTKNYNFFYPALEEREFFIKGDFSAGFIVNIIRDGIAVNIPLLNNDILAGRVSVGNMVSFVFNIDKFNPFFLARRNLK